MIRISLSNLTILDNLEAYCEQSLWVISLTEGYCSATHIYQWNERGKVFFKTHGLCQWLGSTMCGWILAWIPNPELFGTAHLKRIIHYKEATTTCFCIFNSSMGTIRHPSHLFSLWHLLNKFVIQILWLPNYFHTTATMVACGWSPCEIDNIF